MIALTAARSMQQICTLLLLLQNAAKQKINFIDKQTCLPMNVLLPQIHIFFYFFNRWLDLLYMKNCINIKTTSVENDDYGIFVLWSESTAIKITIWSNFLHQSDFTFWALFILQFILAFTNSFVAESCCIKKRKLQVSTLSIFPLDKQRKYGSALGCTVYSHNFDKNICNSISYFVK